ncbi:MAG: DMT family transporter [Thermaerobacter sp.]|nr:DMT family transporter [Thermaerobacter sp.]
MTTCRSSTPAPWALQGALLIGVLSVSSAAILIKLTPAPPAAVAFWRLALTVIITVPWFVARRGWTELQVGDGWGLFFSGVLLALHFFTWIWSLSLIPVAVSTALVSTHPIMVAMYHRWVEHRRLSRSLRWGGFLALAGLFVMIAAQGIHPQELGGMVLAVAGAAFAAGYLLTGQSLRRHVSTTTYSTLVYFTSAIILGSGQGLLTGSLGPLTVHVFVLYVLMAVIPTLGGHTLFNWMLRYTPAATVSLALLGEIAGATILAWLILRQTPPLATLCGVAAITAGLGVVIVRPDPASGTTRHDDTPSGV